MTAAAGALGLATVDLAANALGAKVSEQWHLECPYHFVNMTGLLMCKII